MEVQNKSIIFVSRNKNNNDMNNRNNTRLEELAREYNATMKHAEDLKVEYSFECLREEVKQMVFETLDELDSETKMGLFIAAIEDPTSFTELIDGIVEQVLDALIVTMTIEVLMEMESEMYEKQHAKMFKAELERMFIMGV